MHYMHLLIMLIRTMERRAIDFSHRQDCKVVFCKGKNFSPFKLQRLENKNLLNWDPTCAIHSSISSTHVPVPWQLETVVDPNPNPNEGYGDIIGKMRICWASTTVCYSFTHFTHLCVSSLIIGHADRSKSKWRIWWHNATPSCTNYLSGNLM